MALQIYTNPNLAPELLYAGANQMGHGLGLGLAAAGEHIGAALDQRKKESQEADALRKLAEVRGWADKDTLNLYGIGQLRGLAQAKHDEESYQLRDVQTKLAQAQLEGAQQLGPFAQALGQGGDFNQALQQYPGAVNAPGFATLAHYAGQEDMVNPQKDLAYWSGLEEAMGSDGKLTPQAVSSTIRKTGVPTARSLSMTHNMLVNQAAGDKNAIALNRLDIWRQKVNAQVNEMSQKMPQGQRMGLATELGMFQFSPEAETMSDQQRTDKVNEIVNRWQKATPPQGGTKTLTKEQAQFFLQQAGGDKNKAREMARQAGFSF